MKVRFTIHPAHKMMASIANFNEEMNLPDDSTSVSIYAALEKWVSKGSDPRAIHGPDTPVQYGYQILEPGTESIARYLYCERIW